MTTINKAAILIAQSAILSCCLMLPALPQQATQPDKNSAASAPKASDDSKANAVQHDGMFEVGGPVLPPKLIKAPNPKWTKAAKRARLEGKCVLSVVVNVEGRTQDVQVIKTLDMGLDESAVEAVKKYRFKPATLNGKPVPVKMQIVVDFRIW